LCERTPPVFAGLPILGGQFGAEVLRGVQDATLAALLAAASLEAPAVTDTVLPEVVAPLLKVETQPLRITHELLGRLLAD
jgi:hypothetical protein